jgi:hypothetical protein
MIPEVREFGGKRTDLPQRTQRSEHRGRGEVEGIGGRDIVPIDDWR